MRIKKALCHQSFNDSPEFTQKHKNIHSLQSQTQAINRSLKQLDRLSPKNQRASSPGLNLHYEKTSAAQVLSKMLKKSAVRSNTYDTKNKQFYNSQVLSPQQVVAKQNYQRIQRNKSQTTALQNPLKRLFLQTPSKKILLQKLRTSQNSSTSVRCQSNQDEYYNLKPKEQLQIPLQSQQTNHKNYLKKSIKNLSSELIEQRDNFYSQMNRSRENFTSTKKKKSKSLFTLSTIKQKIQKYLAQQQSRMNQLKGSYLSSPKHPKPSHIFTPNPNVILIEKNNKKLIISPKQNLSSQLLDTLHQKSIFSSFISLTKKKEAKHALEMMKRRLNFSQGNRSLKDNRNKIMIKMGGGEGQDGHQQVMVRKKQHLVMNSFNSDEQCNRMQNELLNEQLPLNSANQLINQQQQHEQQTILSQSVTPTPTPAPHPKPHPKQYLYNLYYYPPITKQPENLTSQAENHRYKDWHKESPAHKKLVELLNRDTRPVDPIECYYNSFLSKNNSIESLLGEKRKSPTILYASNSTSLSPLGKRNRIKLLRDSEGFNDREDSQDDRIIFVNKRQKQNMQQRKMSNLLNKIEKRNNQIQKLGKLQAVELFKSFDANKHKKVINGLNITDYIEDKDLALNRSPNSKDLDNFIVQWPKKQLLQIPETKPKTNSPKKKNNDDWTSFQPWKIASHQQQHEQHSYPPLIQ